MSMDRRERNEREEMQQDMPKLSQAQGARDLGREGRISDKMKKVKPGQARRRLRQKFDMDRLGRPGRRPMKYGQLLPIQVSGANPEGKGGEDLLPMTSLDTVVPYYGATPSKAPTKAPSKAPTKQPTRAPTYENPLEQFKGAFGRKEGRDVEAEMKSTGELRRLRGKKD